MVPVGGEWPTFCIDKYEVKATGKKGSRSQLPHEDFSPTEAITVSVPGVIPTVGLSFDQAKAACANTIVRDENGKEVGRKHLTTRKEWEDAGDGVLGNGGYRWPYGDTWQDDTCATPKRNGVRHLVTLSNTGSYPECSSPFGVMDQLGNAWEWVDSEYTINIQKWFELVQKLGFDIRRAANNSVLIHPKERDHIFFAINGMDKAKYTVNSDGQLVFSGAQFDARAHGITFSGYLFLHKESFDARAEKLDIDIDEWAFLPAMLGKNNKVDSETMTKKLLFLPVHFNMSSNRKKGDSVTQDQILYVLSSSEGASIPDKRGCAWYVGVPEFCTLKATNFHHMHDFQGTIGFRCASDLIKIDQ